MALSCDSFLNFSLMALEGVEVKWRSRLKFEIPSSEFVKSTQFLSLSHLLWSELDISVICTLTAWDISNLGGIGQRRKVTYRERGDLDNNSDNSDPEEL